MKTYSCWNWPQSRKRPDMFPWYRIAWHAIWILPIAASVLLLLTFATIAYGPRHAMKIWRELW